VENASEFVNHYETLQLSQNADGETIERVYRLLAKRYHPDNKVSGDETRFRAVREAYEVLARDPEHLLEVQRAEAAVLGVAAPGRIEK